MEWIAVVIIVALALGAKGGGSIFGGGDKPIGPGGGDKPPGGGGGGGGGKLPEVVKPKTWGNVGTLPSWFKPEGNSFWISPNCDAVAEGQWFLPTNALLDKTKVGIPAVEEPTLSETLANKEAKPINSAYGFIDYLLDVEGYQSPDAIAFRIIEEAAPICADVPQAQWPAALRDWHASFTDRIGTYVYENVGGIGDFNPTKDA